MWVKFNASLGIANFLITTDENLFITHNSFLFFSLSSPTRLSICLTSTRTTMSQSLITAEALRAVKRRQLAKSSLSASTPSRAVTDASKVKLEVPPPSEGMGLTSTVLAPKPEPMEVKLDEPPVVVASAVVIAQASQKRPWSEESTKVPLQSLSRSEMA